MQRLKLKTPQLSRAEFNRRADEYLKEIQKTLMPDHAAEFIAINMATGEYVLGKTTHESFAAFRKRWRGNLMFQCRVDGGPAIKFRKKCGS